MLLLIKMYPDQVGRHWDILKPAIEAALPEITRATMDRMNSVFQALIAGQLDAYLVCEHDTKKIRGLITTSIFRTIDFVEKHLLLYTIFAFGQVTFEELSEAWNLIKDLAKGNSCDSVVAYTGRKGILEIAKKFGAETNLTFIRMEV